MSSRTVAILLAAAAAGVAGGAVIGLAPGGGEEQAAVQPAASTSTSTTGPRTTTTTATARAPWLRATQLGRATARVAAQTRSEVGVVVRPLGTGAPVGLGTLRTGAAWSTIKVPLVLAHLQQVAGSGADDLIAAALQRSDNAAAQQLFDQIADADGGLTGASADIDEVLRQGGDDETQVNTKQPPGGFSTYGQTQWSLALGTRFFQALGRGCLRPRDGSRRVLGLMSQVVADQRWGVGRARFGGASAVRLKGGWGPGADGRYLVRQFAIVEAPGRRGIVVALAARTGTFQEGVGVVDRLAAAVARATRLSATPASPGCP
jgi:hypothetical protein